jgi:hypothetical protein
MLTGQNTAVSSNLATLVDKAGAKIAHAIQNASAKTGVDFSYLLQQAQVESSFKADAKACSSSATGLYQFIDKTWLSMVDKYGDKYGLSDVTDKKQILELRKDPELCSLMAAELASENKNYLEKCTGQEAGATELYMAHFMGPAGASKFLNALDKNPNANAASLFPAAAAANKNVFYDKSGTAKSLEQVYALFDKKFSIQDGETGCSTAAALPVEPSVVETPVADTATDNVIAALTPTTAPLYTKNSSLFTNRNYAANDMVSTGSHHSFFPLISPVDVLELLKSGYTDNKTNA